MQADLERAELPAGAARDHRRITGVSGVAGFAADSVEGGGIHDFLWLHKKEANTGNATEKERTLVREDLSLCNYEDLPTPC